MKNQSFSSFDWRNGLLYDHSANLFPTKLHALVGNNTFKFQEGASYFIFQYEGVSIIKERFPLYKDHYACCTIRDRHIQGNVESKAIIIERLGYNAMFTLGGPIEEKGRLKYIDGCTDSLLIPPVKHGDACLNHLHFPPGIYQTMHTHPSIRVGIVKSGRGECVTPYGNIPLFPGQIFIIHKEGMHCFKTFDVTMDVIAYHPDSDFGPKDEEHPMINRTIVGGISAKHIPAIKTK